MCVTEHLSLSVQNQFSTKRATSSSRVSYHSISDHIYKLIFHAASRIKTVFSYLVNNYYPVRVFRILSPARQFQSIKSGVVFDANRHFREKTACIGQINRWSAHNGNYEKFCYRSRHTTAGFKRRVVLKNLKPTRISESRMRCPKPVIRSEFIPPYE